MCRGGGNYGPGPVAKHPLLAAWLNSPCHVACHACSNLHTPSTWRAPPPCRGAGAAHGGGAGAAIWGGPRQGAELWVKLMQGGGAVTHHSPPSVTHLCLWGSSFVWARRWVGDCAPARSSQRAPAWVLPGVLPEFNPPSAGLTLRLHCCPCVLHPRWCAEPTPPPSLVPSAGAGVQRGGVKGRGGARGLGQGGVRTHRHLVRRGWGGPGVWCAMGLHVGEVRMACGCDGASMRVLCAQDRVPFAEMRGCALGVQDQQCREQRVQVWADDWAGQR